jgi:hypothetical protein
VRHVCAVNTTTAGERFLAESLSKALLLYDITEG